MKQVLFIRSRILFESLIEYLIKIFVPKSLKHNPLSRRTFVLDLTNSSLGGILEVGFGTFAILIAIRFLQAPDSIKAILASGVSAGLLIVPMMQRLAVWSRISASRFCALLMLVSAACLFWAAYIRNAWILTFALFISQVCFSQLPGFMIQVYAQNYSAKERGKRLSWNFILSASIGMILSYSGGSYLDMQSAEPGWIFRIMGLVSLGSATALFLIPSEPIAKENEHMDSWIVWNYLRKIVYLLACFSPG